LAPDDPEEPEDPDEPDAPEDPLVPEDPDDPEVPDIPEVPDGPDVPAVPDVLLTLPPITIQLLPSLNACKLPLAFKVIVENPSIFPPCVSIVIVPDPEFFIV
jgi:hypothetical protein